MRAYIRLRKDEPMVMSIAGGLTSVLSRKASKKMRAQRASLAALSVFNTLLDHFHVELGRHVRRKFTWREWCSEIAL